MRDCEGELVADTLDYIPLFLSLLISFILVVAGDVCGFAILAIALLVCLDLRGEVDEP